MRASVQFSRSVLSDSLQPHGLQHARPPCPSPIPGVYSNSCSLSPWCHSAISSSILLLLVSVIPSIRVFSNESVLLIRWPKYWGFQLQYQSFQWVFRTDFLQDGLVGSPRSPRDSQESSPTPQFKSISSLALSLLYGPSLTSIHDYWKNQSFDYTDNCWQSNDCAFKYAMLVITFLPRIKCLWISWIQSQSVVILEPKKIKSLTVSIVSPSICHGTGWHELSFLNFEL